ncbi:uncharacterized protein LOC143631195 [Bidens hawaiensis]|uniref:uncharacterized protein LOC143631195 n=1 Tax=Bidens hawaiensis TaxID=980011 RepID=UPI00404A8A40
MSSRITKGIVEALPMVISQLQAVNAAIVPANPNVFTIKQFTNANPTDYFGTKGATTLLQWFEHMESVFLHSACPDDKKTTYVSSVFKSSALTWWTSKKRDLGGEVAMALPWDDLKKLMLDQFYPKHELRKLEKEFWNLKQEGGDNTAYNNRFHELSDLIPHMVTPLERAIDKYISGLPMKIQDSVLSRDPKELRDAIALAEIANGSLIVIDSVVRNCTLTLNGQNFSIDLIPMQMGSFDVIIDMDWLSLHRAEILCFEKIIRIPIEGGVILNVAGERPFSKLNLMSCLEAQRYLRKKYVAFLAHVTTKAHEEKQLSDIPIVRDFPEVFPEDVSGLPPIHQVEFRINLVPGANPVAILDEESRD